MLRGAERVRELELFEVEEAVIETRQRVAVAVDGEVPPMDPPLTYRIRPLDLMVLGTPASEPSAAPTYQPTNPAPPPPVTLSF